jgi:uncharacterized protein DUF6843
VRSPYRDVAGLMLAITLTHLGAGCAFRPPDWFEIPAGYRGWVEVYFGYPQCEPLTKRDGHFIYRVAPDGWVCTSTLFPEGSAMDRYEYIHSDGRRETVPAAQIARVTFEKQVVPADLPGQGRLTLFIGTAAEIADARNDRGPPRRTPDASGR